MVGHSKKIMLNGYKRRFVVHKDTSGNQYIKLNGNIKRLSSLKGKYTKCSVL
jgi:hypothetical protein